MILPGILLSPKRRPLLAGALSCVFAALLSAGMPLAFGRIGSVPQQLGLSLACGAAAALLALLPPEGLRAFAAGIDLFLAGMVGWALAGQVRAWAAADGPRPWRWQYQFYYDRPMCVLAAAMAGFLVICLARLVWPPRRNSEALRQNTRAFFRTAAVGLLLFTCCLLVYGFLLVRTSGAVAEPPNWVPGRVILEYWRNILTVPGSVYEESVYFLGNIFLFFPLGFFLRILFRRQPWLAVVLPAAFSAVMELLQLAFRTGHCDVDDFLLNTFGAVLGCLAVWGLEQLRKVLSRGADARFFD
ncbi:MAG: VanZ family protein [Oscillospiraceae bacterium]|jgi:glycopeptide antibiotics resistance protein|nr:VanZ family protein [Oscillospiraceae bacterium]